MDGLVFLVLAAAQGQSLMGSIAELAVLATSIVLTIFSALALYRQLLIALWPGG